MNSIYRHVNAPLPSPGIPSAGETPAARYARICGDNRLRHNREELVSEPYVSVAVIAADLGVPLEQLTARLGDAVQVDASGLRVCTRETSARVIAEHHAAVGQARAQAAARRQAQVDADPVPALRARLHARPTAVDMGAKVGEPVVVGAALAAMREISGDRDRQLDDAAATRQELTTGTLVYHRYDEKE